VGIVQKKKIIKKEQSIQKVKSIQKEKSTQRVENILVRMILKLIKMLRVKKKEPLNEALFFRNLF
jgi:hypothetical protein